MHLSVYLYSNFLQLYFSGFVKPTMAEVKDSTATHNKTLDKHYTGK